MNVYFNPALGDTTVREEALRVLKAQKDDDQRREADRQAREQALAATKTDDDKNVRG